MITTPDGLVGVTVTLVWAPAVSGLVPVVVVVPPTYVARTAKVTAPRGATPVKLQVIPVTVPLVVVGSGQLAIGVNAPAVTVPIEKPEMHPVDVAVVQTGFAKV